MQTLKYSLNQPSCILSAPSPSNDSSSPDFYDYSVFTVLSFTSIQTAHPLLNLANTFTWLEHFKKLRADPLMLLVFSFVCYFQPPQFVCYRLDQQQLAQFPLLLFPSLTLTRQSKELFRRLKLSQYSLSSRTLSSRTGVDALKHL